MAAPGPQLHECPRGADLLPPRHPGPAGLALTHRVSADEAPGGGKVRGEGGAVRSPAPRENRKEGGAAGHEPGQQTEPVLPHEGRSPCEAVWGGQGVGRGALQPLGFRGLGDGPRPREAKTRVPLDALGDLGEGGHLDLVQSLWDLPRGKEGPLIVGLKPPKTCPAAGT